MSATALDLFPDHRGAHQAPRPVRHENPIATPADMKRTRLVQAIFTCASPRRAPLTFGGVAPKAALERVLQEIGRLPGLVSVHANPATPHDVEIRDESDKDGPRHLMALVFTGLNIAEARLALQELQASSSLSPKGRRK